MGTNDFKFLYKLDKNGPRCIAIKSWLDKKQLGLVLNDFQNFCTIPLYADVWNKNDRGYLYTVAEDVCISDIECGHLSEIRILVKHYAWVTNTENILKYF